MHVDILSIHYRIIDYLTGVTENNNVICQTTNNEYQKLQELKLQYGDILNKNFTPIVQKDVQIQISELENKIQQLNDKSLLHFYLLKTQPIIDEYKKLLNKPVILDFMNIVDTTLDKNNHDIDTLINSYLYLIKKYFASFSFLTNICDDTIFEKKEVYLDNGTQNNINEFVCQKCGNKSMFETFDNQNVCGKCGIVLDQFNQQEIISFKDAERVNMNSKYTYDRKTHFKDCIHQFQGKQNVSIHPNVYKDIIEQLISYSIIPHNYKDLPKAMAFENVTKEHIYLFLKQTKNVKHYEDATLIYHELTGKSIPDISHLEELLIHDFDLLVEQYDKKYRNITDRKNFINTQYILYQLLNRHHYNCSKDDFNMLKTIDRRYYHDEVCSALFEELGWNHKPIF